MLRHTSTVIDDRGSIALLLEVTKANDMPVPKPMGLHYSFNELGLNSIRFAKHHEVASLETEPDLYRSIKDLLDEFTTGMTMTAMASQIGVPRTEVISKIKIMLENKTVVSMGKEGNEKKYGLVTIEYEK